MIERTFDVAFVNRIVNHPSVDSLVRGPVRGSLDLSPVVEDRRNIVLIGEHGFAIFAYRVPGVYEWHAAVRPEGHGSWALSAAREALDWIFAETDAVAILAPVPEQNRAARQIVAALGFTLKQTLPRLWPMNDRVMDILVYVLLRREWMPCQ